MVAVKVFTKSGGPAKLEENEMQALSCLDHPNIIKMVDCGEGEISKRGKSLKATFMATELLSKGELFDVVAETGGFSEKTARFLARQIFGAVGYAHSKGLVHRDLKLENIMLDDVGNIKIIDFGFSAPVEGKVRRNGSQILKTVLGTPGYMAPEIFKNEPY